MKILYLVPYAPTLIRTRPFNLLRSFARAGQQVTLFTLLENDGDLAALKILQNEGVQISAFPLSRKQIILNGVRGLFSDDPLQAWYSWQPTLFESVLQNIRENHFDIIQLEHLRAGVYLRLISEQIRKEQIATHLVWDAVDCISLLFEQSSTQNQSRFGRKVSRFELPRTRRMERELLKKVNRVLVTSKHDRDAFLAASNDEASHQKIQVLPNGVDLEYFQPADIQRASDTILFSGKMSYHANISAALFLIDEIMPIVWQQRPEAVLQLAGKDPPSSLQTIAESESRIKITGSIPDMRPYLQKATIAAAPIRYGTGIQNKVLEAMACGTPVIATPQAISGLDHLKIGREAWVAQDANDFAGGILTLLQDDNRRRALSSAGIEFVRRWHDWDRIVGSYLEETEALLNIVHNE